MSSETIDPIKDWLDLCQEDSDGLVLGANVLREAGLTLTRQRAEDDAAMARALGLNGAAVDPKTHMPPDPWHIFRDVLDWPESHVAGSPTGPAMPDDLTISVPEEDDHLTPSWAALDREGQPQFLVMVEPDRPADKRAESGGWAASPHHRLERLVRETGVGTGILVVPGVLRLIHAPKGETAGWITWPLVPMTEPGGRAMLAGLKLALDRARIWGKSEHRLAELLRKSREAQNIVSEKLAVQVLGALHDLLRGLHAADPERIERLAKDDPAHLYEGLLTCLMRLVFLLYAEDRDLLPTTRTPEAVTLWQSGYSIRTLFARLDDDAGRYFDVMEDRRGGWGQLLAVFRLIHAGHDGWIKGRGGKLFDPNVFPFLEGREAGGGPKVLPVSDDCIHRVLQGLTTLPAATKDGARERLSYRTLDVEQIGSVYETVMGFTTQVAGEPMIALVDEKGLPTFVGLDTLLRTPAKDRAKWLKDQAIKPTTRQTNALKTATTHGEAIAAFAEGSARGHRVGLIDLRGAPDQSPIPAGAPYLQPTAERRRSGSHYTPRELTAPIVEHALKPAFDRLGTDATPDDVLRLKVCDPACGSGAFLVEACRQLGDRLVQAWAMHSAYRPAIPSDETEETHARRLIAQRCLYGVDRNPMAVDLAKLSLWLATLAAEHEFTFLDHAVKAGDSLVGLSEAEVERMSWDPDVPGLPLFARHVRDRLREAREGRRDIRTAGDDVSLALQEVRLREAEAKLATVRDVADAVTGTFFAADKAKARRTALEDFHERFGRHQAGDGYDHAAGLAQELREDGIAPFHWPLEFPEVFDGEAGGFDAIVGNPPFAGKNTISEGNGPLYIPWLQARHAESHGNADLVAHFFRRAYGLLRDGGAFGLIATNTIGQGDTRTSGLRPILASRAPWPEGRLSKKQVAELEARDADRSRFGGTITRAVKRLKWPGEAAVVVSVVHVVRGEAAGAELDRRAVDRVSAYLVAGDYDDSPTALEENSSKAFIGSYLLGMGFTFDDKAAEKGEAESLVEMERLIAKDPQNAERIKPYIGGEEVNTSPTHAHHRYAIDFEDFPLRRDPSLRSWFFNEGTEACDKRQREWLRAGVVPGDYPGLVAADWPDLLEIVERRVKPERMKKSGSTKKFWWRYERPRPALYGTIRSLNFLGATVQTSPNLSVVRLSNGEIVFDQKLVIIADDKVAILGLIQCRAHEVWVRYFSGTQADTLNYTPSDSFLTFPFPADYDTELTLEAISRRYVDHRAALMKMTDRGMTKTYNDFHDATLRNPSNALVELRSLHAEMDRAVLRAYGWNDLADTAAPLFLAKPPDETGKNGRHGEPEDDYTYQGRLHWPAPFRDEVLRRLLALNATRAAGQPDPTYATPAI